MSCNWITRGFKPRFVHSEKLKLIDTIGFIDFIKDIKIEEVSINYYPGGNSVTINGYNCDIIGDKNALVGLCQIWDKNFDELIIGGNIPDEIDLSNICECAEYIDARRAYDYLEKYQFKIIHLYLTKIWETFSPDPDCSYTVTDETPTDVNLKDLRRISAMRCELISHCNQLNDVYISSASCDDIKNITAVSVTIGNLLVERVLTEEDHQLFANFLTNINVKRIRIHMRNVRFIPDLVQVTYTQLRRYDIYLNNRKIAIPSLSRAIKGICRSVYDNTKPANNISPNH